MVVGIFAVELGTEPAVDSGVCIIGVLLDEHVQ